MNTAALRSAAPDTVAIAALGLGAAALLGPTLWDLGVGAWAHVTQGHEIAILAICAWLLWRRRAEVAALPAPASRLPGALLIAVALLAYAVGRSQQILRLEMIALPLLAAAVLVRWRGFAALRPAAFALGFSLFAIPLPFEWVLVLTAPLKTAVSAVAVWLLDVAAYPVARTGVVLTIGQYELLVTEACAGLQTMFTLEAMGLLYASLVPHARAARNVALAVVAIPAAFAANVVRVVALALITYHFGDAAGQGFLHGFSGLVLFVVALLLIIASDRLLVRVFPARSEGAMNTSRRDALGLGAAMLGAAALAAWMRPRAAGDAATVDLGAMFPQRFGAWQIDAALQGFVRTNDRHGKPHRFYDQVLERHYRHVSGAGVMLSVAFGNEQSTALQLHRPEVCYRASGYRVSDVHPAQLELDDRRLPVTRLHARRSDRSEPITYWTIVGGEAVADHTGALARRWRFALQRVLPDGLLVRVSSIDDDGNRAWALHAAFAAELAAGVAPAQRERVLGVPHAA